MCAIIFLRLDNLILANFLKAELGFLGVVKKTLVQVPLLWGHFSKDFNLIYFFFFFWV